MYIHEVLHEWKVVYNIRSAFWIFSIVIILTKSECPTIRTCVRHPGKSVQQLVFRIHRYKIGFARKYSSVTEKIHRNYFDKWKFTQWQWQWQYWISFLVQWRLKLKCPTTGFEFYTARLAFSLPSSCCRIFFSFMYCPMAERIYAFRFWGIVH